MYCVNCGKEIKDNSKFCIHCGEKQPVINELKDKTEQREEQEEKKQEKMNVNSENLSTKDNQIDEKIGQLNQKDQINTDYEQDIAEGEKYNFAHKTLAGIWLIKYVETSVTLKNDTLNISQNIKRFPGKDTENNKLLKIGDISSVSLGIKMDLWNTAIAVICVILGFFRPVLFIFAAILLWISYGRVLEINTKNGEKYVIPFKGDSEPARKLMSITNKIN